VKPLLSTLFAQPARPMSLLKQPAHALYRAAQVRAIDAAAIAAGTPGYSLMRRAGAALLDHLQARWPACHNLLVFVGGGNNGGDGYVLAQLAAEQGMSVRLIRLVAEDALTEDARRAANDASSTRIERLDWDARQAAELLQRASPASVVVDAMLGTGIRGALREPFAQAVSLINGARLPVLSVDIPTGLDSDSGVGEAVVASMTVTFIALKRGLFTAQGPACCGELRFARLQVDESAYRDVAVGRPVGCRIAFGALGHLLSRRRPTAHKGDFGHVLVVGGDLGFGGAALMAAEAAARSGAGTVSLLTREAHVTASLTRCPEVMVQGDDSAANADPAQLAMQLEQLLTPRSVLVVGPGLGGSEWSKAWLRAVLQRQSRHPLPLVVDADALNLLAADERLRAELTLPHPYWLLTPHPGEAARLLGSDVATVQADRFAAVAGLQQQWGGYCLLKGAGSLLATPGQTGACQVDVCTDGNPGMASGGMGDVLAGLLGGLLAQASAYGWSAADTLRLAVCLHAAGGDLAAERLGEMSLLATDLVPSVASLLTTPGSAEAQR